MTNQEKYCLFFDYDGTISVNGISQANIDAIKKVQEAGHYIFLNTGRSRGIVPKKILDVINWDGLICGASYIELHGEILSEVFLSKETVIAARNFGLRHNMRVIFEGKYLGFATGPSTRFANIDKCFDDMMTNSFENLALTKFTFSEDCTGIEDCKFDGVWLIHHPDYTEALTAGFDKSTGIKIICDKLNIPYERTVSFGDSLNDLDMIKFTGKSVIMHSAVKELDQYATIRTKTDKEGVAEGINQLFFSK